MKGRRYQAGARKAYNETGPPREWEGTAMKTCFHMITSTLIFCLLDTGAMAETMDRYQIYPDGKATTKTHIKFPAWFKQTFFNLQEDLAEARQHGKRGVIVMLSQESCSTCKAFLKTTFSDPVVLPRVMANYDVIGMDIFSELEVVEPDGTPTVVKDFAEKESARLTPTILFFGVDDDLKLKIVGFYPPEKFQHVLDYIDRKLYSKISLRDYLRDKRIPSTAATKEITQDVALFGAPTYDLAAAQRGEKRPMLVVFERPDCNPCRRFHERVLALPEVRKSFPKFRAIQLDASDNNTKIVIPDGRQLTPQQWYGELQLSYDVAVVFFDEDGHEVMRLDAEIGKYRMAYTMDYVVDKGYLDEKQVLRWRKNQAMQQATE
ncbi:MAG: thioredoxin fold domain-containing protein [Pseudomonadota bacterium]|nr:MAG: thioredoxin fold domain-containing protein [Pseudomonadota bacterium]